MYLTRELTDLSLPKIGEEFGGRDHTTVIHAYDKIKEEMNSDLHYNLLLKKLSISFIDNSGDKLLTSLLNTCYQQFYVIPRTEYCGYFRSVHNLLQTSIDKDKHYGFTHIHMNYYYYYYINLIQ